MTEPTAPTPTEATPYNPGGDMTQGVARAHIETPEEIAANPIDDEPNTTCMACLGGGSDLDEPCPASESGEHVFDATEDELPTPYPTDEDDERTRREWQEAHPEARERPTAPPTTTTPPTELPISDLADQAKGLLNQWKDQPAEPYSTQHAKVLRFELSIGKNDDARTLERFEQDIRAALAKIEGEPIHNVTLQGGYYIIDGKVCLPADYDPATKNRKPGTYPPSWAGGPEKGKEREYLAAQDEPVASLPPVKAQPAKTRKPRAKREEPAPTDSAEDVVAKLAGNMTREVQAQ